MGVLLFSGFFGVLDLDRGLFAGTLTSFLVFKGVNFLDSGAVLPVLAAAGLKLKDNPLKLHFSSHLK